MKRLKTVLTAFLFFLSIGILFQGTIGCGSCVGNTRTWDQVVPKISDAVAAIDIVDGYTTALLDEYEPLAGGSGFVISPDGYVVTNAHVVAVAELLPMIMPEIWVRFADNRKFIVQDYYIDELVDIALLKINAQNLPYLEFETEETLKVGQDVMTISNSYPFEFSFTEGVVSRIEIILDEEVFIQHTAPINSGSSGSPLINRSGRIVGVNVALAPRHNEIYFAIHADLIMIAVQEGYNVMKLVPKL